MQTEMPMMITAVLRLLIATTIMSGISIASTFTRLKNLSNCLGILSIIIAINSMTAILATSEGWNCIGPMPIHLDEPCELEPIFGTNTSTHSISDAIYAKKPSFFQYL